MLQSIRFFPFGKTIGPNGDSHLVGRCLRTMSHVMMRLRDSILQGIDGAGDKELTCRNWSRCGMNKTSRRKRATMSALISSFHPVSLVWSAWSAVLDHWDTSILRPAPIHGRPLQRVRFFCSLGGSADGRRLAIIVISSPRFRTCSRHGCEARSNDPRRRQRLDRQYQKSTIRDEALFPLPICWGPRFS